MHKVKPGEQLKIGASTFNTLIDAARDWQMRTARMARRVQPPRPVPGTVLVRNESGAGRDRFSVLGVDSPLISPTDNLAEFQARVALRGVVPAEEHAGRFVILAEPLPEDGIGRAYAYGTCPAKVKIMSPEHAFAEAEAGSTGHLVSSESGIAQILWAEDVAPEDVAWALVRLGGGVEVERICTVKIGGLTEGNTQFSCTMLDADGHPTGNPFPVRAFSIPRVSGLIGQQNLGNCVPRYIAGDFLRIMRQNVWTGAEWVHDFWAVDTFTAYGCYVG